MKLNYFELLMPVDRNYCTDWLNGPLNHEKLGLLLCSGGKHEYIWIVRLTEAPFGDSVPSDSSKWTLTPTITYWTKESNQGVTSTRDERLKILGKQPRAAEMLREIRMSDR